MRSISSSRLLRWRPDACPARRCYSVRVPGHMHSGITTVADLKSWTPGSEVQDVEICGWVRSVRKSSGVRFVDVTDGSSMRPVQVVVNKAVGSDVRPGAAIRFKGTWRNELERPGESEVAQSLVESSGRSSSDTHVEDGQHKVKHTEDTSKPVASMPELQATLVEVLGPSDPRTLPIQNKYQTPESLRNTPHLRPRTPLNSTMLRLRSDALALLTQFFFQEKFQQTHPPIITSSDCEGAGEAFSVKAAGKAEFFRDPKYLTVSSQLHLEALAQALGNVWTISPTFRAEQSDTSRHLSEFYMLEAEMSFVQDMDEVMDLVQRMLASLAKGLKQLSAAKELDVNRVDSKEPAERLAFQDLVDSGELQRRWKGLADPRRWPRITYTEAVERLQPLADQFEHKPVWGAGLQSEHEKYLAREIGYDKDSDALLPIFITQYPREIKAFYMPQSSSPPSQGSTVDCFDLIVPDLGELAGGSMREHRLQELEDNMRFHGLPVPKKRDTAANNMDWYLDLRRWGSPPHGGFGLGFDRLLSYLTGVPNVREVVPFPRYHERCDC